MIKSFNLTIQDINLKMDTHTHAQQYSNLERKKKIFPAVVFGSCWSGQGQSQNDSGPKIETNNRI